MLRVNGKATRRRKLLALYCLFALVFSGCGPRRTGASDIGAALVAGNRGKVKSPYKPVKPKDFSQHIRGVFRASAEHYAAERALRASASESGPEDPEIVLATQAQAENPDDPQATRRLADLLLAANRNFEAFEHYSRLLTEGGPDPEVSRALAIIWDRWGDYPRALEHAVQAVAQPELQARDWLFLGRIHLRGGNRKAGVAALRKATELDPADGNGFRLLGEAFAESRDWESAGRFLTRAAELDPGSEEVRRKLAEVLARSGERETALRHFLSLEPAAEAYNELGRVLLSEREWRAAHDAFAAALLADPNSAPARWNLAETLPYLPLPAVVTLTSFEDDAAPLRQAHIGRFPDPVDSGERPEWAYFEPPAGIDAAPPPKPSGPLIIDVSASQPNRLFAAVPAIARRTAGEADPLSSIAFLRLPNLGPVEAVVQLPPAGPALFPKVVEGDLFRVSESIRPAADPTRSLPSAPVSGIVQLPPWDPDELPLPAQPPVQVEAAGRDAAEAPSPGPPINPSRTAVSLDEVSPVPAVNLEPFPWSIPAETAVGGIFLDTQADRVSALIAVGEVQLRVTADPADPELLPIPGMSETVTVLGPPWDAGRRQGGREMTGDGFETPRPSSPPGIAAVLRSLLEDAVEVPALPVVRELGERPAPKAMVRQTEAVGRSRPVSLAARNFPTKPANRVQTDPVAAPRIVPSAERPDGRSTRSTFQTAARGSRAWADWRLYPRPFVNRGAHRFGNWRAEPADIPSHGRASVVPLPAFLFAALLIGMMGGAVAFRRPTAPPSTAR